MDSGIKRLLKRPTAQTTVLTSNSTKPMDSESKLDDDDAGSVHDSDDEGVKPKPVPKLKPKPKPVEEDQEEDKQKKVVKRVVKKVVRKDNE